MAAPTLAASQLHRPELSLTIRLGAAYLVFTILNGVGVGILSGFEAFRDVAVVNLWSGVTWLTATVFGTYFFGLNGAVVGLSVATFANCVFTVFAIRKHTGPHFELASGVRAWDEVGVLWSFAVPAALAGFLIAPVVWYSNVLLSRQPDGYAQLGIFSAAQSWQNAILFLPQALAPAMLAYLSHTFGEASRSRYSRLTLWSVLANGMIAGLGCLVVVLFAHPIMRMYGREFTGNNAVLITIAISAIPMALCNVVGYVIASAGKMWLGFAVNLLWTIAFTISAIHFVPLYGATGLALTYMVAYALHFVWTGALAVKYVRNLQRPLIVG
jgi:O-antigen/teichoic acid export membrane protein